MQVCTYTIHTVIFILYTAQNKHRATNKLVSDEALGKEEHTCISTFFSCSCSCYYLIWNVGVLNLPHYIIIISVLYIMYMYK